MKTRLILGTVVIGACGGVIIAQQNGAQRGAAPYNNEQVSAGRTAYRANCAACHAPDLTGREGPQLAGANFMARWGEKSAGEFIAFMRSTMPPGAGGSLPDQTYVNLAAFIFDANGARPGDRSLTAESNVVLRDIASGKRAAPAQQGAAGRGAQQANQGRQTPRGITVAGEVKNYVPVTDAMLRNPDPADWLMIRHDYKATYFSTLNQITAQNVNDMHLIWSWSMQEGAGNGNQPAPLFITVCCT